MLKKLLIASVATVAMAAAQAQTITSTFEDGVATFSATTSAANSKTYNFSFVGLQAGLYEILGSFSGTNFTMNSATFNGQSLSTTTSGPFSFGSFTYNGTSPFVLSITGVRATNGNASITGSLSAVSPVPEPESIAMMLAGLGVIGAVVRRRNRAAQPAAAAA